MNELVYERYIRFFEQAMRLRKQEKLKKRYRQSINRNIKEGDNL